MLVSDILRRKRDGQSLSKSEIDVFVSGVVNGAVSDAQIAAFTMAIFLNGMDEVETAALTAAMAQSGEVLKWDSGPVVDKHSTGGIGDATSLLISPWLIALGLKNPMISGRGLGHTGGTLDKLESIQGFKTEISPIIFQKQVLKFGGAIVAQSENLAPADKRIYAVRDVTATVSSLPLITASILSKKLAAGLTHLILDVKFGNGAFMKTRREAYDLARLLCKVGQAAGCHTNAIVSDMNHPLLSSIGNAVEIRRVIEVFENPDVEPHFFDVSKRLVVELLQMAHEGMSEEDALALAMHAWDNGQVHDEFLHLVHAQGGALTFDEILLSLPQAQYNIPILAQASGYVCGFDLEAIGNAVILLGGGRTVPHAPIDHAVGLEEVVRYGAHVTKGDALGIVHANDKLEGEKVAKMLANSAFEITRIEPAPYDFVIETVRAAR